MPVYNSGHYLSVAIDSVLKQSLREIELILVDDGSTDGSSALCDEYALKDERVVVIHQKNGGICAARNAALKVARGEYVGFSDHDDVFINNQLFLNYENIRASGADFIKFGHTTQIVKGGRVVGEDNYHYINILCDYNELQNRFWSIIHSGALVDVWDGLFNLEFLRKNKIEFNDIYRYGGGEDIDFNYQCFLYAQKIQFAENISYLHYIRDTFSTSSGYRNCYLELVPNHMRCLGQCIIRYGLDIDKHRDEYTYYWITSNLISLCRLLAKKECPLSSSDKNLFLAKISSEDYFYDWMMKQRLSFFIRRSKLAAVFYWLFIHKYYWACVKMFKLVKFKYIYYDIKRVIYKYLKL